MKRRLFIGNVSYRATEADLENFFAENEIVADKVKIMEDQDTGRSRGFGFAEVAEKDFEAALALNGRDLGEERRP